MLCAEVNCRTVKYVNNLGKIIVRFPYFHSLCSIKYTSFMARVSRIVNDFTAPLRCRCVYNSFETLLMCSTA